MAPGVCVCVRCVCVCVCVCVCACVNGVLVHVSRILEHFRHLRTNTMRTILCIHVQPTQPLSLQTPPGPGLPSTSPGAPPLGHCGHMMSARGAVHVLVG